ncbi:lysylphosphatidylglycerol synthase transmembrane domain-containing protein [Aeoliella mucimassa]|uniref:lysylphosphatidylglycerol synthase transmembrane domain-containing protein n=1 Tax=Aeoliella mucimassa TaxID=2527972 RepID=UPI001E49431F|nr:YbhN family protein [Aeoliella mucimassa]
MVRFARWAITLSVVGLVVWFAGGTVRDGWHQLSQTDLKIQWQWVALSALLYLVGLAPMACYWWIALRTLGETPTPSDVLRGYYLGHLGKYVPGKALVVVLRTGALVRAGCNMRQVAISVFLETLTFMAGGGMLAALLLAITGHGPTLYVWLSLGLAVMVGIPITPPVARWLATKVVKQRSSDQSESTVSLQAINWRLTCAGLVCSVIAWSIIGVSLWSAARAVDPTLGWPWQELPLWIEAVALPVVAGFLSLIPGGLMVRDGLQVELLKSVFAPEVAEGVALVVVALWRLVSVASEGAICVILEATRLYRTPRGPS